MKVNIGKYRKDGSRVTKVEISDDDLFSLDDTLARVMLPALKKYKRVAEKYIVIEGEFRENLDAMIEAFELISSGAHYKYNEELNAKIQKGLDAFARDYLRLWY